MDKKIETKKTGEELLSQTEQSKSEALKAFNKSPMAHLEDKRETLYGSEEE